jgi:hypothetical protein
MASPTGFNMILDVAHPFTIVKSAASQTNRRVDVWISDVSVPKTDINAVKTSWFGRKKQPSQTSITTPDISKYQEWRHLDMVGWKMFVHTPSPTPDSMVDAPWTGQPGQKFTNAMSRIIVMMMGDGATPSLICSTLRLDVSDLWSYKSALEKGLVGIQAQAAAKNFGQMSAIVTSVPGYESPIWLNIARGTFNLDIKTLSLRLLLTKVKSQYLVALDDEVRSLHVRELHRYFERNQRVLAHEIAQINQNA